MGSEIEKKFEKSWSTSLIRNIVIFLKILGLIRKEILEMLHTTLDTWEILSWAACVYKFSCTIATLK